MECLGEFEKFLHDDNTNLPVLIEAGLTARAVRVDPSLPGWQRSGWTATHHVPIVRERGVELSPCSIPVCFSKPIEAGTTNCCSESGARAHGRNGWHSFSKEWRRRPRRRPTADRTVKLFAKDRSKIQTLGRASPSALRVHELMQTNPFIRIRTATKALKLTVPTVTNALNHLVRLGIVKEISGKQRDRLFAYSRYVSMVSGDTQPL